MHCLENKRELGYVCAIRATSIMSFDEFLISSTNLDLKQKADSMTKEQENIIC